MTYTFDTSAYSQLKHYHPEVFKTLWRNFEALTDSGLVWSTREVQRELEDWTNIPEFLELWLKPRKTMFHVPNTDEQLFVGTILAVPHFRMLISKQAQLRGSTVADPFVIANAKVHNSILVTQEDFKPNAARIPNICAHYSIPCINFEEFLIQQNWIF
jgi:hypothetical protein